ncbi:MAG: hypothetical protein KatS3mg119_1876 [Rhodothalassiaceae bacterium]|nr:MAG: hypothetical protein KatS3mg119_1876 [Rhodothalassiaceae bacterium]
MGISNLAASVSGNTVTLTWTNTSLPLNECQPSPYDYPHRTWRVYRNGVSIWSETRTANHQSPNGRTSYSETVADGSYIYGVETFDEWGMFNAQDQCVKETLTSSRPTIQVDVNVVDTTPDPFTFVDLTGVGRETTHYSNYITVTGIGGSTSISISGSGEYQVNDGAWTTASGTVNQGDVVRLKMTASTSFSTTVSTTLNIGGVTDTWSITTKADSTAPLIYLPSSFPLKLRGDVRRLFGPYKTPYSDPPAHLTDYVRGGTYVPDISANNSVPVSPPISLSQLLGAAAEWKWVQEPSSKHGTLTTVEGNFKQLAWYTDSDAELSVGGLDDVEFRWTVTPDQTSPKISVGYWLADNNNTPLNIGSWIAGWQKLIVQGSLSQALDPGELAFTNGTITLEARPKSNTSLVISTTAGYSFVAADRS